MNVHKHRFSHYSLQSKMIAIFRVTVLISFVPIYDYLMWWYAFFSTEIPHQKKSNILYNKTLNKKNVWMCFNHRRHIASHINIGKHWYTSFVWTLQTPRQCIESTQHHESWQVQYTFNRMDFVRRFYRNQ